MRNVKRIYRTRGQAALIAVGGLIITTVGIATVMSDTQATLLSRIGAVVINLILSYFLLFRVARSRLLVLPEGVQIVNPLRSVFLPWDRIDRFSLRPWGLIWTPIGHANLKDGSSVHILGIAAPNPAHWPKHRSAHKAVAELNGILEAARSGVPPV